MSISLRMSVVHYVLVGIVLVLSSQGQEDRGSTSGPGKDIQRPMATGVPGASIETALASAPPSPGANPKVQTFEAEGVIVAVHDFFAMTEGVEKAKLVAGDVAGKALVTAKGVHAFIETPGNAKHLADIKPGKGVHVKGKIYKPGMLLHIDTIQVLDEPPALNLETWANATGREATLKGKNKCQCGIRISELHTSCSLGHLHHLEAADGRLYHYLQFGPGKDLFQGKGTHFKEVAIRGTVLPGQWVWVEQVAER